MATTRTRLCFLWCWIILQIGQTFSDFENVATGKSAYTGPDGLRAPYAVDGIRDSRPYGVCVETPSAIPDSWWEVDLTKPYFIHQVRIYLRTDWKWRRNGVHVYVSSTAKQTNRGHLCGVVTGRKDGSDIPDITDITCDYTARYVTLYQETDNGYGVIMDFCEVQVYACQLDVKYGSKCDQLCSQRHCVSSSSCDGHTGSCDAGCQAGWTGVDCKHTCSQNVEYGFDCDNRCEERHCSDPSASCEVQTGSCGGCQAGWTESDCSQGLPQEASDKTTVVYLSIIGVFVLLFLIAVITIIRLVMIVRRKPTSTEPSVAFVDKIGNNENRTTSATSPSSVYEAVYDGVNVRENPGQASSPSGRDNMTEQDYDNSTRNQEHVIHVYDEMKLDDIGQASPYDKLRM